MWRPTVGENQVSSLEAVVKEYKDAYKRSVDVAGQSRNRPTDAAAQLAESPLRTAQFEENAKVATEMLTDME